MQGMDRSTGKMISGIDYLQQRLNDVLTTPKRSRIMRREYGCGLFQLLDENINASWLVQAYSAVAEAIDNPENGLSDFSVQQITPVEVSESGAIFELSGIYLPTGEIVELAGGLL